MDNPEKQAILGTRQRTKTNKKKNGQPGDTGRRQIKKEWTTQRHRQYWAQDRGGRQIKQRMDNPETQAILSTRQRRKTNKTKNGQPRDTGNIKHKIQEEDK